MFARSLRIWLLVPALILCTVSARAQSTIVFDPVRDLANFEACSFSEYHDLYPIDAYVLRKGNEMTAEELEGVRLAWKADCERAARQIELLRTDPREAWLYALKKQLAKHSGFSRISYSVERPTPGIALLVEKPYREDVEHASKVAQFLGPWLAQLEQVFTSRVVTPFKLTRRDGFPLWTVAILSSEASYRQYASVDEERSPVRRATRYDPRLKMVVGYLTSIPTDAAAADARSPILTEFVREMQHAYFAGAGDRPGSLWLNRGYAGYLAICDAPTPDALGKAAIPADMLARVVDAFQNKGDRDVLLHPVEDLVQARDDTDVMQLAGNRSEALAVALSAPAQVIETFEAQSVLWMHFLQHGQGGRFKEPFQKFLGSAMEGRADLGSFRIAFLEIDMGRLNRDFYQYLLKEHERVFPKKKVDVTPLATLFVDRDARKSPFGAVPPPAPVAPLPVAATFTPASIAVDPLDFEPQHGMALVQARRGELEAALERLRELAKTSPPAPEDARIAREIERVEQTIRLRDGYFEYLRQSGKTWVTVYQRQELTTPIQKVEDGFVHLGPNSLGISKIPLKTIPPFDIARQAGQKEEQGGTDAWVRFYPYVLAGESKWEKLLKDDSPKAGELREDARDWYPDLIRTGEVALELNTMSKVGLPETAKQANALLGSIKTLNARYDGAALLQRNIDKLRQLATAAALKTYVEKDPTAMLHGAVTAMGDGTIHLVYDFNTPGEADDFTKDVGYLGEMRAKLGAAAKTEADSAWKIENGDFTGVGAACYRHILRFTGPLSVAYELRYGTSAKKGKSGPFAAFGMCDDRHGNYFGNFNFADLAVIDLPHGVSQIQQAEGGSPVEYGRVYALELRHDGKMVSTWLDGEKKYESAVGAKQSGDLFLWFNTDYKLAVQKIEIQGKLDNASVDAIRNDYVAKKLSEAGFH